jgi:hypothetical protein
MRTFTRTRPERDVLFVASSGHELGHLGIDAFIERNPGIVKQSAGWIHLGANIGALRLDAPEPAASRSGQAAGRAGNTIQASDDALEAILSHAMAEVSLTVARRTPRGTVPGGEAEAVHRGGGRYVSVIGANAWFHNPGDRGTETIDVETIARFTRAFAAVANALVANPPA